MGEPDGMYLTIVALCILMSIAVGWSIGANDAANSLGTAVGSRVLTLRQAIILILICGALGAILEGATVAKTIGKGIVQLSILEPNVSATLALVAAGSSCLWVVIATYWKMPISTSHSIVGAVAGVGVAMGLPVKWSLIGDIFLCWVCTPIGAAVLGYVLYQFLGKVFPLLVPERYARPVLTALIILSGCYVAYSWGANDVANATGLLAGTNILSMRQSVMLGGLAIVLGVVTWGYKVIDTVGSGITHLMPMMAFAAQLASALNVHAYTMMGMPVSTSHSIVGAIVGVGWVQGMKVVNLKIMKEIVVCWIATPFVSGVLGFGLMRLASLWIRF